VKLLLCRTDLLTDATGAQEYFDRIEGNEQQIRTEERILSDIRKREQDAITKMNKGATALQKLARGRKARQEYQKMLKAKNKGKGKGKGKKK
jgi:hypothetical protein